ncbi:hypothetical protein NE237_016733 [Protea cynaroides]|uniref:mitogen-activated protein kinase kinase kinase n=1 Tax=Protea cynaroides TaxID=273540 RepID=A0A9Q0HIY4_9MAGN|nr:hypothetical protein NE237_016733 [Protea cynaroides]
MPAWWGRKSHKSSKEQKVAAPEEDHHNDYIKASSVNNDGKKSKEKRKSFDDVSAILVARNSARTGKDFGGSCGSDSDGHCGSVVSEKKGHPLPRPSVSSAPSLVIDHGVGSGCRSGSVSVSSVSSSGSSDDASPHLGFVGNSRAHGENNLRSRSPGPGSRGPPNPTSPLHPRLFSTSMEPPTGKQEDGISLCHPLPLPPVSPTNICTSPTIRSCGANESTHCLRSKWKKGKLLGRGTFGHVYVGFNSENGQMCAIKEVRVISDDQSSKECLKQLNQEITLLSQLSHPNIVQYYGSELGEETLSVYLEYISGGSIHKLLQEYGPFKEPVIQSYTRQILSGLAYLHGRNTVHRDIKGANILVGPTGEVKLADFGMAKHITSFSSVLSFKGSPYWMAPEVVMNSSGYSLAVDIWSLGCTILEMATSKPPWSQYEGVAAIFKIGNSKDIPEIPDHLSTVAKNFLKLCLRRDPFARPTAAQLMDHPFIRDQAALKVANINITTDAPRSSFEGSHTLTTSEFRPNRANISIPQRDLTTQIATSSRAFKSARDSIRVNQSLPVSRCSSPLRQYGPAHKSCFLSPPHPAYTFPGHGGYGLNDNLMQLTRPKTNYAADPWGDILHPRIRTPGGSPRD